MNPHQTAHLCNVHCEHCDRDGMADVYGSRRDGYAWNCEHCGALTEEPADDEGDPTYL